ncbi:MAG: metallophosphoesterase [Comamonadaceae bacterium]|nr:MAG: metallophosphoesterase [Comamonadaceae bacterium]
MSTVLLHVSDPHFGTEQAPVMRALAQLAKAQAPALVVLSGDITQRATRAQFGAAKAFFDGLRVPLLAIPGNHDIPLFALGARLFSPYGRYREAFGDALEPVIETDDCLAIAVNTTRWYRHEDGEVSAAQIERVATRLARATPQQLRVVVVHQPVAVTLAEDLSNRLHGRDAAVPRWAAAGADLLLGGHIHLPFVQPLQESFAATTRASWAVQAGTALSTRVRAGAPNSVNVIRYTSGDVARRCVVERWDCVAGAMQFSQVKSDTLLLADNVAPSHAG